MEADPYRYFRVEAHELHEQLGRGVLELERSAAPDLISRLLRLAHTLKGAARVVKQREIADLAHGLEDALAPLREAGGPLSRQRIDGLLASLDAIGGLLAKLQPAAQGKEPSAESLFPAIRPEAADMDALLDGLAAAHVELASLRRTLSSVEGARHTADLLADQLASPRARAAGDAATARVRAMAQDLSGSLSTTERSLGAGVERLDRELGEVRDAAERLRLLPADVVFTSLQRAARDAAQALGKRVAFAAQGGDVRLDAHVLGTIHGALLQMVRNAVAHGIEAENERRAAGKAAEGRVTVEAARQGSRVTFRCRDDGRGVDLEAVQRAAQKKGWPAAAQPAAGGEDLLGLLLQGGLSTAGAVTEMSGRGVGLDVVRAAAAALGGEVRAQTWPGQGTVFELLVPVSVSSFQALLVEADGVTAAIPLEAVKQALRLTPGDLVRSAQGLSVAVGNQVLPFVPLQRALDRRSTRARASKAWSAVVVGGAAGAAVGVDRLAGTQSILLRPLPRLVNASPVVAGAFLDAAGDPQWVLDPDALVAAAYRLEREEPAAPAARPPILVIDDSLTTRMLEQSILESAGYEVDLAISGEEALAKARRHRYSLFLVDVEMPGMDGFAFIERARADPLLGEIPAILVTSRSSPADRRRGEEVGAAGYVVKSEFDQSDLLQRIRRLLR